MTDMYIPYSFVSYTSILIYLCPIDSNILTYLYAHIQSEMVSEVSEMVSEAGWPRCNGLAP